MAESNSNGVGSLNTTGFKTSVNQLKTSFASLSEQSKKSSADIASHFGSLKNTIMGITQTITQGMSLNDIIADTESAEKTMAMMDKVLKSTGGSSGMTKQQLINLADAQGKVTTYSKETTLQAENMLLTFTNIGSKVFPQTLTAVEDMSTAMGISATDAAKTLGTALNDPSAGVSKLKEQGVLFTAAQENQINAMQKAGNTAGAQKEILASLEKQYGGSAKAAGKTLSGQIKTAENTVKSAGLTITTAVMPIINKLMPSIVKGAQILAFEVMSHKEEIQSVVSTIVDVVQNVFKFILAHGKQIISVVAGIALAFVAYKVISSIISIITAAIQIWQAITKTMAVAQAALNLVMSANPIGIIIIAIGVLIAGLVLLFNNCKPFHDWVVNAFNNLKAVVSSTLNGICGFFTKTIPNALNTMKNFATDIWNNIAKYLNNPTLILDAIRGGFTAAIDWILNLPKQALNWGKDIINGVVDGIKSAANAVSDAVEGVAQNIRSFLHFSTPDEGPLADFDTYMPDMMGSLAHGMKDNLGKVRSAAWEVAAAMSIPEQLITFGVTQPVSSAADVRTAQRSALVQQTASPALANIVLNLNGYEVGRILTPIMSRTLELSAQQKSLATGG